MIDPIPEALYVPQKLRDWLNLAVESGASDLHLVAGYPPVLRVHGDLMEMPEPELGAENVTSMLRSFCSSEAFELLQERKNIDFSFDLELTGGVNRFRANLFLTGGQLGACLRLVPNAIPDFEWSGFPYELARRLALRARRARDRDRGDRFRQNDHAGDDRQSAQSSGRLPHHHR